MSEQVKDGGLMPDAWRKALKGLLGLVDANTCRHESAHRGGAIWTICDGCGKKWADDCGGFVPYADEPVVAQARSLLAAAPSATPEGGL